jgi:cytochrome c biogenesis protein CcdA
VSAVPCGAGYFVLLQSAVGGGSTAEMLLVLMAYIGSFLAPYVVASILSSRIVRTLEKISGKIALVELAGGLALISIGMYLALRKV